MKLGNTTVISFMNLKGGVGKTTAAVNVASTLASLKYLTGTTVKPARVLLIDLDPQSNASLTLLRSNEYNRNKTIVELFKHELDRNDTAESYDLEQIRITPISELNLDLIPSGLELFDIQDELVKYQRYYLSATDILFNALSRFKTPEGKAYTHIIIDCPPSLGLVTLNGLSLSKYYIVPTLLDAYSHWGLNKIIERVNTLKRCKASCEVELLGILYSRVDTRAVLENRRWDQEFANWEAEHRNQFRIFPRDIDERIVFQTQISNADIIRKSEAEHRPLIAYSPADNNLKKAQDKQQKEWQSLVLEILKRIALHKGNKYDYI